MLWPAASLLPPEPGTPFPELHLLSLVQFLLFPSKNALPPGSVVKGLFLTCLFCVEIAKPYFACFKTQSMFNSLCLQTWCEMNFFSLLKKEKGLPVDVFTGAGLFLGSDFLLLIGINTYLCFANKRMHVGLRIFASWAVQGNISKAISCFSNEVGGQSRCLSTFSPRNTSWWVKPKGLWFLEGSLWKCAGWKGRTRTGSVLSEHSWEFPSSQVPLPCDLCKC